MKKFFIYLIIFVWFIIVLLITSNTLLDNKVIYLVVTIPLLVIPVEMVKRFLYKEKR